MKQPDNSPTLTHGTPHPQQVPKASRRRVLSKAEKCALLVASVAWLEAGCAGVQTRPEPEACHEEAIQAMRELGWMPGFEMTSGPWLLIDMTQGNLEEVREQPYTVWKDGPVRGALAEPFGKAPEGMRLDGHLWTTGDRIYGRYVRAHLPGGRTVPICLELTDGDGDLGHEKAEGSKPGHAVGHKASYSWAVKQWR